MSQPLVLVAAVCLLQFRFSDEGHSPAGFLRKGSPNPEPFTSRRHVTPSAQPGRDPSGSRTWQTAAAEVELDDLAQKISELQVNLLMHLQAPSPAEDT